MESILVIEDEEDMIEIVSYTLKNNGFEVEAAKTMADMWATLSKRKFDLLLLDIGLPDGSGIDALKSLRQQKANVAVIMMTARRTDMDKILGLELGADDYITKPFNNYELLARVRAVLRRTKNSDGGTVKNVFNFGDKTINLESYTATDGDGSKIEFTNKEFELLKLLITSPKKVFTREEILDRVWGADFFGEFRTVDVHVSKIREKLGDSIIRTIRGVGYRLGEIEE